MLGVELLMEVTRGVEEVVTSWLPRDHVFGGGRSLPCSGEMLDDEVTIGGEAGLRHALLANGDDRSNEEIQAVQALDVRKRCLALLPVVLVECQVGNGAHDARDGDDYGLRGDNHTRLQPILSWEKKRLKGWPDHLLGQTRHTVRQRDHRRQHEEAVGQRRHVRDQSSATSNFS
ncbi:hypothetical protein PG993_014273 [Apiospora rasikravindrae]|uniref:Uncharacterized protein n=1 Tax=Apiospora rasikravindrae TaxID=990691 RepID=A0ABR1RNG4_9PEZI